MKKIILVLTMLLMAAGSAFAQSDLQPLVIVKYNKSETITVKQLKSRCDSYEKQMGQKLTVDQRKQVLNTLIDEKLVLQAAAKAGITIPDSAVDQYFMEAMSQSVGAVVTEKELNDLLKAQNTSLDAELISQTGMNVSEYKAHLKNQLIAQQYVISVRQAEIQATAATDAEIRAYYEGNKASFVWNDMIKFFMIIVPKGDNADKALTKANDLRNKYVEKKLTADQITVQSKIEGSGYQAGELLLPKTNIGADSIGMSYQGLLLLFGKDEGFVTDVQETSADYRIVVVGKKYDAKMLSISDVVQPETTVTVYEYIRSNLAQQKQMLYVQQAAQEIADSLNKPEYVEEKKSGAALDKLLAWETN